MSEDPATYTARPPTPREMRMAAEDEAREASVEAFIRQRDEQRSRGKGATVANERRGAEKTVDERRRREQQRGLAREWFRYHSRRAQLFQQLADEHLEAARSLVGR